MDVRQVTLGSTFKTTWVSSGAVASPIVYNVFSGSETLVSSYAAVDSGDGHYYVNARIDTPGLYQGAWFATVSAQSYRNAEWVAAYPTETDQPGRYVTWDDVVNRFTLFSNVADAIKAASHYLHYAEADLDSRLGAAFTTPFSSNNVTARDLTIDMVYLRAIRWKTEGWKDLKEEIDERIGALNSGTAVMVTTSGETYVAYDEEPTPAWSNTQDYHPMFAASLDYPDMVPSSQQMIDEADERGF